VACAACYFAANPAEGDKVLYIFDGGEVSLDVVASFKLAPDELLAAEPRSVGEWDAAVRRYYAAEGLDTFCGEEPIHVRETEALKESIVSIGDHAFGHVPRLSIALSNHRGVGPQEW
jgi:hypothetical protein